MSEEQNKREILKDQVVALVKDFMNREGGISQMDLGFLFGPPDVMGFRNLVASALANLPIKFSAPQHATTRTPQTR